MKFEDPEILFWLWALIPAGGFLIFGIRRREKILARFADPSIYPTLVPGFDMGRRWIKAGLIVLALGFAVVALAGPRMGFRWEKTTQRGVDIMIGLDCSRSMLAGDVEPSRLERAKREIIDLLHLMTSDRAGLVAFAGQAILQCPLTLDHEAFNIFLKVLEPDYLPVGGTNLTAAIETCYSGFEPESNTQKAIILITDGEDTAGQVDEAAKKMAEQGIKIFCIGVGDPKGAPVPGPGGGFKKDKSGNIILSRVDEKTLEKIAAMTQGKYVRSVAGDMDLDLIYTREILGTMERKTLDQGKKKVWEQRFQWFLLPCVLVLLMEFWLPVVNRKKVLPVLILGLALTGLPGPAHGASAVQQGIQAFDSGDFKTAKKHFIDAQLENPDDPRLYYNIGTAAYMDQEYEQAEKNFAQAAQSPDPELSHNARFNLANTRYRMGKLEEAAREYEEILKAFPGDKEARENLEFVKEKLEEQKEQQNKPDENLDNPDKEKDKKDQKDQKGKGSNQDQNQKKDSKQDKPDPSRQGDQKKQDQQKQDLEDKQNAQQKQNGQQGDENRDRKESEQEGSKLKPDQKADSARAGKPEKQSPGDKALESKLNRLEDKPGMALMPAVRGRAEQIEKDW
ncbi:vWA domain-containing protein [Desulfospira joergensenii]|uniref:vWA domain-containing protein n=1 Tax=Desulfospira joergensenii TaxID=53329 RepID=UPI0003B5A975|nr:VWA domain-containing protein [Desulfospira joergensenii]